MEENDKDVVSNGDGFLSGARWCRSSDPYGTIVAGVGNSKVVVGVNGFFLILAPPDLVLVGLLP